VDALLTCLGPSTAQRQNSDIPTSETNDGKQASSFPGERSSSSHSDSLLPPTERPGPIESTFHRYHIYKLRRDFFYPYLLKWSDASVEDFGDTSDFEYLPSEQPNNEWGDEIENGSKGESWETQDTESGNGSNNKFGGFGHNRVQDSSECGSSEFWDSEVDCYPLSDVSEDGVSIEGNDDDAYVEGPVYQDDGDGNLATNPRRNVCDLRPNHGYTLKGLDVDSLRRMALSTIIGTGFAGLPLMRHLIDSFDDKIIHAWSLEFWRHRRFGPKPCDVRDTLIDDLNTCLALKEE
jgi:hypothetical protein